MEVEVMRDGQRRTLTVVLEELEEGECENVFFAPGERHSFEWHSDGDHSFVMPTPRAFAPQLRAFRFGAPMMPLHRLAPMAPLHGMATMPPLMPLRPASPGEVSVPPAPPPAPAPPARIV